MISDFMDAIKEGNTDQKGTEVQAEVKEIDNDTVWVDIPGMDGDTPVQKTIDCKPGDMVMVRIEGGKGRISGNLTTPPTDNTADVKKLAGKVDMEIKNLEKWITEKIDSFYQEGTIKAKSYRMQDNKKIAEAKGGTASTGSVAAGASKTVNVTVGSVAGKKLIAVAGIKVTGTNSEYCVISGFFVNSTTEIGVQIRNTGSAAATWTVKATGLYITN